MLIKTMIFVNHERFLNDPGFHQWISGEDTLLISFYLTMKLDIIQLHYYSFSFLKKVEMTLSQTPALFFRNKGYQHEDNCTTSKDHPAPNMEFCFKQCKTWFLILKSLCSDMTKFQTYSLYI
jgi:hypothetical protein